MNTPVCVCPFIITKAHVPLAIIYLTIIIVDVSVSSDRLSHLQIKTSNELVFCPRVRVVMTDLIASLPQGRTQRKPQPFCGSSWDMFWILYAMRCEAPALFNRSHKRNPKHGQFVTLGRMEPSATIADSKRPWFSLCSLDQKPRSACWVTCVPQAFKIDYRIINNSFAIGQLHWNRWTVRLVCVPIKLIVWIEIDIFNWQQQPNGGNARWWLPA